jgi:SAM-dependent methyltransferase
MQAEAGRQLTIHWVVQGVAGSDAKGYTSDLATNRYRAIIPARELRSRGHQVHFIAAYDWQWDIANPPDVVVLGKLLISQDSSEFLRLSQRVLAQGNRALAQGVAVIVDFNDDHFDHPVLGHHWRSAAALATLCTAGSNRMASAVTRHARGPVVVVGDPIASPVREPRVFRRALGVSRLLSRLLPTFGPHRLKLVWYGHPSNWPAMEHWARDLEALSKEQPFLLWLVTKPSQKIQAWVDAFNRKNAPAALAEWVQWDEETQWSYVRDADAVLLPSDPADPKLAVKSGNRLTEALNAGRYVVASAVPSYRPFDAFCSLTEEPAKALNWMIRNPEAALGKIAGGQQLSQELASVAVMADKWAQVAIDATSTASEQMAAKPLLVAGDHPRPAGSEPCAMTAEDKNPYWTKDVKDPRRGMQLHCSDTVPPVRPTLLDLHIGKAGKVSDKWEAYFHAYERLFSPLRDQAVNLLEIGVQNGGSLEVWSQYFANAAQIIGCDVDPKCANLQYVDPRIEVVVGDATAKRTRMQVMEICDSFDIVIDDGSHLSSDIVNAFLSYFPLLKPGGLYVVEDTHALYRPVPGGGVLSGTSAQQFFKHCAELINLEHWEGQLPVETLMSTFIPRREEFPTWLALGGIESIEFRNSMVSVRKAESRTALGRRMIGGSEAQVHPAVLKYQVSSLQNPIGIEPRPLVPNAPNNSDLNEHDARSRFYSKGATRLNLGCGDKIIPGYINVDVAASRSGRQPDVICDLRNLSVFGADYAEEVLAVHVVEHFWRWEVEDILRGWVRVLKPGGRMILECPNLISACEEFLKDPVSRCRPSRDGQRTMWVFYGDPSWQDPLMVHRWAYTPDSLSELLGAVGLVDVRQEPAQYKLREPRDMRITGRKPALL